MPEIPATTEIITTAMSSNNSNKSKLTNSYQCRSLSCFPKNYTNGEQELLFNEENITLYFGKHNLGKGQLIASIDELVWWCEEKIGRASV